MNNYTLLRNLKPILGTHKRLPQSVFCLGGQPPDPLRLIASLSKPKHTCCIAEGAEMSVLSTLEQGIIVICYCCIISHHLQAQHILSDPARLKNGETPVGISLRSKYSALFTLNLVKHVYYLPAMYGRLPESVNLVEDGIPFHYLLNPSAARTPINVVRKVKCNDSSVLLYIFICKIRSMGPSVPLFLLNTQSRMMIMYRYGCLCKTMT
jgi:hypothetical protein